MNYLGIDFGTKKIGLAIGDSEIKIAYTLPIYFRKDIEKDLEFFKNLITEKKIDLIIIGKPIDLDGSETKTSKLVDEFIDQLNEVIKVEIKTWDETMTTQQALDSTDSVKSKRKNLDSIAARIMLQEFLDFI